MWFVPLGDAALRIVVVRPSRVILELDPRTAAGDANDFGAEFAGGCNPSGVQQRKGNQVAKRRGSDAASGPDVPSTPGPLPSDDG